MIVLWVVSDLLRLDTLKKHQKCKLIRKEDVRQYQLLFWSCRQVANQRFDYLVDWDPEALKNSLLAGKPLIHAALDRDDENMETFAMLLKAGMKYLPEHLGLLFRKNSLGTTACEFAFEQQGKDETFKVIQERIIPIILSSIMSSRTRLITWMILHCDIRLLYSYEMKTSTVSFTRP